MVRRMTRVAGLVLVLTCLPFVLSGLGLFLYGFAALSCPPTAPVCRFGPPAAPFLIGGLLGAVGVVHVVVGIGIMRGGRRAQLLGLIVSVIGAASAAFVGSPRSSRSPTASTRPATRSPCTAGSRSPSRRRSSPTHSQRSCSSLTSGSVGPRYEKPPALLRAALLTG